MWTIKHPFILLFESKINLILIMWKIENPFILLFESIIKLILILWTIKNPFILLFESKINSFWFSDNKIKSYLILIPTGLALYFFFSPYKTQQKLFIEHLNMQIYADWRVLDEENYALEFFKCSSFWFFSLFSKLTQK